MPTPTNLKVIRSFIEEGRHRRGGNLFADKADNTLYSYGYHFPLVVRLPDGFLVNGSSSSVTTTRHQDGVFHVLDDANERYVVVPFDSIGAALYGSPERSPWPTWSHSTRDAVADVRSSVSITVPTNGERWREVAYRKPDGTEATRVVHTLGDSVIRLHDHHYISAVDDTGVGRGIYFLTQLITRRTPDSLKDALDMLEPEPVRQAERMDLEVSRQGEWFAIPQKVVTRKLMRDVRKGLAVFRRHHVLGRDGHHKLTEAVIYKCGPAKGEVYARGTMRHTRGEHRLLSLPKAWFRIVRNIQGQSYSLVGNFD